MRNALSPQAQQEPPLARADEAHVAPEQVEQFRTGQEPPKRKRLTPMRFQDETNQGPCRCADMLVRAPG